MRDANIKPTLKAWNILMDVHANKRLFIHVEKIALQMHYSDVTLDRKSWHILLKTFALDSNPSKAYGTFIDMVTWAGIPPNKESYNLVMKACENLGVSFELVDDLYAKYGVVEDPLYELFGNSSTI